MRVDRGSASVYVVAAAAIVLSAGLAATAVGTAMVARHRAETAADLGALAAAASVRSGSGAACAAAHRVIHANGARLVDCRLQGPDAVVTAAVSAALPGEPWGWARVAARAGPVDRVGAASAEGSATLLRDVRPR